MRKSGSQEPLFEKEARLMQLPIAAFLYDFDKTLCTTDMQDYAFIPSLGMTPAEFWLSLIHI